jgi:NDP-sugar pyrophosphorylase family protein
MIKTALIMAAGRGARMAPLTDDIPKPMAPYGGSTLIAKGIDRLIGRIENIYVTAYPKRWFTVDTMEQLATLNSSSF